MTYFTAYGSDLRIEFGQQGTELYDGSVLDKTDLNIMALGQEEQYIRFGEGLDIDVQLFTTVEETSANAAPVPGTNTGTGVNIDKENRNEFLADIADRDVFTGLPTTYATGPVTGIESTAPDGDDLLNLYGSQGTDIAVHIDALYEGTRVITADDAVVYGVSTHGLEPWFDEFYASNTVNANEFYYRPDLTQETVVDFLDTLA